MSGGMYPSGVTIRGLSYHYNVKRLEGKRAINIWFYLFWIMVIFDVVMGWPK